MAEQAPRSPRVRHEDDAASQLPASVRARLVRWPDPQTSLWRWP